MPVAAGISVACDRTPCTMSASVSRAARTARFTVAIGAALLAANAGAEGARTHELDWSLCSTQYPVATGPAPHRRQTQTEVSADQVEARDQVQTTFKGHVELRRADQRLYSDRLIYEDPSQTVHASGDVRYRDQDASVDGDRADMQLDADRNEMRDARFQLYRKHARGASEVVRMEGAGHIRLHNTTYTTCDAGQEDWLLRAKEITLDDDEGKGTARSTTIRFKGVPVLYLPYLSFPTDDRRKSGFLPPGIGNSDKSGFEISTPYYFNLAPNRDATLTPRYLSERGLQLQGEYRYLTPSSHGTVNAEVLQDDVYGGSRGLLGYRHQGSLGPRLRTEIDVTHVSDDTYFTDLGTSLSIASRTNLERRVDLYYQGAFWGLLGRVQDFQTVDPAIGIDGRPYRRAPQLLLQGTLPTRAFGLQYDFRAELVRFDRRDSVTGDRLDLMPSISLPLRTPATYLTPRLSLRYTGYRLDGTAPGQPDGPDRTQPIVSVDSGLFLERDLSLRGVKLRQTLEPRAYYLYVPHRNQDDIPLFDTGELDFDFYRLFLENRFTGPDRIGDTNQLTLALTSRLLEGESGIERLRASIGQIYYFENRRVTLPVDAGVDKTDSSDFVAELEARLDDAWSVSGGVQWSPAREQTDKGVVKIRYRPDAQRVLNLSYRLRRDDIEQTDVSLLWPISHRWSVVARWNYSLKDDRNLETLAGLEYRSCCWALRGLARKYVTDDGLSTNGAVYLQLELKGLGRFGSRIEDVLERGILGDPSYEQ